MSTKHLENPVSQLKYWGNFSYLFFFIIFFKYALCINVHTILWFPFLCEENVKNPKLDFDTVLLGVSISEPGINDP